MLNKKELSARELSVIYGENEEAVAKLVEKEMAEAATKSHAKKSTAKKSTAKKSTTKKAVSAKKK